MSLTPGQVLDRKYRIVRLIGEGGMGAVFEGENTLIRRRVAIKVLHAGASTDPAVLTRFEREAQAAGRIGSDHILEVLDLGQLENGDRYMVMEFLDGEPLSSRIQRLGGLSPRQLVPLARQALIGLGAAHAAGIVHRDLKPDNIFVLTEKAGNKDFVKIIDFGISKFGVLGGDMSMTRTGAVMGTPYYMAPEQAKGSSEVDARTDLYAIGVILYECLTGKVPFDGNSFNELMFKIVLQEPPALPESIEPAFRDLVFRAMAREPKDRFQTAQEFIAALDSWAHGAPVLEQPNGLPVSRTLSDGSPVVVPAGLAAGGFGGTAAGIVPGAGLGGTAAGVAPGSGLGGTATGLPGLGGGLLPEVPAATLHEGARLGGQTGGNWAATQGDADAPSAPASGRGLWIGVAAGVVAIAAGAFFLIGGDDGEPAPLAPDVAPVVAAPPEKVESPVAPVPEEPKKVEAAPAEPEKPVVEKSEPVVEPTKPVATKPAPTKPVAAKPVAAKPVATKPAPAPTPAKPKPKPTDFGY